MFPLRYLSSSHKLDHIDSITVSNSDPQHPAAVPTHTISGCTAEFISSLLITQLQTQMQVMEYFVFSFQIKT